MTTTLPPIESRLCTLLAASQEQDPIGSASATDALMLVETPLPWKDVRSEGGSGSVHDPIAGLRYSHLQHTGWSGAVARPERTPVYT